MSNEGVTFGEWRMVPAERRLLQDGKPVDLNARYFDALLLLARHPGELISKERFMAEVWQGVPVTDEALTQCVRSLRRVLGDEAARPRFIETVPKHGYRFVAIVASGSAPHKSGSGSRREPMLPLVAAGLVGGAAAGLVGGLGYGLLAASSPPAGTGAISIVLVLTCLCLMVGVLGGTGVGVGIAAARQLAGHRPLFLMLGGGLGGVVTGALGRLIGIDAFTLLIGTRPMAITGAGEGMLIGAVAGVAGWASLRSPSALGKIAALGALLGGTAGVLVVLGGGTMMAGSLATLAQAHPSAALHNILGAGTLPLWVKLATGAVEGATFVAALSLSFALVNRSNRAPAKA